MGSVWTVCLIYASKNLLAKRKCPMCMAAHPFFLATKSNEPDAEVDWTIPEANRPRQICGCCSEAGEVILDLEKIQLSPIENLSAESGRDTDEEFRSTPIVGRSPDEKMIRVYNFERLLRSYDFNQLY